MTGGAARRIWGLAYRHLALFRRSWPRLLELMYWPTLEMLVWGFVSSYLAGVHAAGDAGGAGAVVAGLLLGGALLWEVTLRSQMGFTLSFMEEIWSRNLGHIFVSPLRPRELLAGLMALSVARTLVGVLPAVGLAWWLYGYGLFAAGPVVVAFWAALMVMGWAVALGVTALILRHGAGAEALAWSVVFGLTPFCAVFYPVATLPEWLRPVAWALPAAHVFEGLRAASGEGARIAWEHLAAAFALDLAWLAAMAWVFLWQFRRARVRGALLTMGE
ncbi:ABC transporter [Caldovatus sediminis]|uniref:ABC transporter n=1 Tax=Caldovatus sediminis TaxID=2041189 RepID=A0A8J2Z9G4_9PROT|nr:ABC transporter permease [Caldovatus sediminis]GGG27111.1 ABC transporter [Caldovatus sediminis]